MDRLPAVFSVELARERGVDARRLRSRAEWERPFRGLRARSGARWIDVAGARVRAASPDAVLFGPSALRLWGLDLPGPRPADPTLHVAVPRPARAPRGEGVQGYSVGLDALCIAERWGIPATTRGRTWVDLARWLTLPELVAVGDQLCRPEAGVCSLSELAAAAAASPRVRGAAKVRTALGLVVPGAESYPESQLRVAIELSGLPRPAVNVPIFDGRELVARVDLLFARWRVVVEYEGAHHATDRRQWRRDLTRIGELQRLGYVVERAHADDLRDPTALIARIRTHLRRRGWTP